MKISAQFVALDQRMYNSVTNTKKDHGMCRSLSPLYEDETSKYSGKMNATACHPSEFLYGPACLRSRADVIIAWSGVHACSVLVKFMWILYKSAFRITSSTTAHHIWTVYSVSRCCCSFLDSTSWKSHLKVEDSFQRLPGLCLVKLTSLDTIILILSERSRSPVKSAEEHLREPVIERGIEGTCITNRNMNAVCVESYLGDPTI